MSPLNIKRDPSTNYETWVHEEMKSSGGTTSSLTYVPWGGWDPNNYRSQKCGAVYWKGMRWADIQCSDSNKYICAFNLGVKCECDASACSNRGTCTVDGGVRVCTCETGWGGPTCNQCAPGYGSAPHCNEFDSCSHNTADAKCTASEICSTLVRRHILPP